MDERTEKMLMASHQFDLRVPYGHGNETVIRIAALAGTCNGLDVLDDPWGNRRIIVIEAAGKFDFSLYNSLDKSQLIAEAYAAFKGGEMPELVDEDILKLEKYTDGQYSKASVEGELIDKYFYGPECATDDHFMTATEIKLHLETFTKANLNINKIGAQLKKKEYIRVKKKVYGYLILKKDTQFLGKELPEIDPPF
jgi:predicted P-loop ATPase